MSYPIIDSSKEKMDKQMEFFHEQLNTVRTGVANAAMLNGVEAEYYGSMTPLNQIASIKVEEGRTLVIKPYDPSSLKDIEKALNKADLGIAPQNDGTVIRLAVPQLTGETRKEMSKKVSKIAEDAKVQIRNIRRDAMNVVKKEEDEIQKLTDKYTDQIAAIADKKSKEVMNVQ